VWAVIVARPADDPDQPTRPFKVVWLGDPTLTAPTDDGPSCAYCAQSSSPDCPGMPAHATRYAVKLSTRIPGVVEVNVFDVDPREGRSAMVYQVEQMLARDTTATVDTGR
jgi:hypothetical protein